jgi:hypothetical protein
MGWRNAWAETSGELDVLRQMVRFMGQHLAKTDVGSCSLKGH